MTCVGGNGLPVVCCRPLLEAHTAHFRISCRLQYVDENYENGGIGEYQYYDPYTQSWDDSACDVHGNGRCAPMDCHQSNSTTWTLMGVFKEASYFGDDAFFEQLFKHEGICVWNDEDLYEFMTDAHDYAWTQGCYNTGIAIKNKYYSNGGSYLYLDLKPSWNGNMTYGLYTDEICKTDYEGTDITPDDVAQKLGLLYGETLEMWNDALEIYKVCQPCMAYNLLNTKSNSPYYQYSDGGDNDYYYYNDVNYGYFQCWDDANYVNVNQCMKFRTHAELEVATWEDLVAATNQGGILPVNISGTVFGTERMSQEEYTYIKKQRQREVDQAAQEQREYDMLLAQQMAAKRAAQGWVVVGAAMVVGGAAVLISSMMWVQKQRKARKSSAFSTPLLDGQEQGEKPDHAAAHGTMT